MPKQPLSLFVSYSHEDERFRKRLEKHLALLRRQGLISEWHDRQIIPGEEWRGQIDIHLNAADIVLLLVSSNFMASDYCFDIETARAMERHRNGEARVMPIILSPVDWQGAPFGGLQALPTGAKPITDWPSREKAFANIVQGIKLVVEDLSTGFRRLLPRRPFDGESFRSGPGAPAKIRFVNDSDKVVRVYWINANGDRVLYNTLAPGNRYIQSTYVTHPWLITDVNDAELEMYLPEEGYGEAIIGRGESA